MMEARKTHTRGNVIVEDIKIGDIHYEYGRYGVGIKVEVITKPVRDEDGMWAWKSKNLNSGEEIEYGVNEKYVHYGPNLYDYEAYNVKIW